MTLRDPSSWPVTYEQAIRTDLNIREELSNNVYVHMCVFHYAHVSKRLPR